MVPVIWLYVTVHYVSGRYYLSLVAPNVIAKSALECMLEARVDSNFLTGDKETRVNMPLNRKNRKWKFSKEELP